MGLRPCGWYVDPVDIYGVYRTIVQARAPKQYTDLV